MLARVPNFLSKILCIGLANVLFLGSTVLGHSYETNMWNERRAAAQRLQNLDTPILHPRLNGDPALINSESPLKTFGSDVWAGIGSFGTIRKVYKPKTVNVNRAVLLIQDVHQNFEAQTNISLAIGQLVSKQSVGVVGLEGAFAPIALKHFSAYPHRDALKIAADFMLKDGKISGPIHAFLTSHPPHSLGSDEFPLVIGIDDSTHHAANVAAYLAASRLQRNLQSDLARKNAQLNQLKKLTFNPGLASFDEKLERYHESRITIGEYISGLTLTEKFPALQTFKWAYKLETSLDFHQVELQRTALLTRLLDKLTKMETDGLTALTVAFRSGQISHSEFYGHLESLCEKKGVPLSRYPAMGDYLRYVTLSQSIDADKLFSELRAVEAESYARLSMTAAEKELIDSLRLARLEKKLVEFALTKQEWAEFKGVPGSSHFVPGLKPFMDFYGEADLRDELMAKNFLRGTRNQERGTPLSVLVVGGFHSDGLIRKLNDAGFTVTVFTPKLTKVDTAQGSAYLGVFAQEKTPLEKLFAGERLFLAKQPAPEAELRVQLPADTVAVRQAQSIEDIPETEQFGDLTLLKGDANFTIITKDDGPGRAVEEIRPTAGGDGVDATITLSDGAIAKRVENPTPSHRQFSFSSVRLRKWLKARFNGPKSDLDRLLVEFNSILSAEEKNSSDPELPDRYQKFCDKVKTKYSAAAVASILDMSSGVFLRSRRQDNRFAGLMALTLLILDSEKPRVRHLRLFENQITRAKLLPFDLGDDYLQHFPVLKPSNVGYLSLTGLNALVLSQVFTDETAQQFIRLTRNAGKLPAHWGDEGLALELTLAGIHLRNNFQWADNADIVHLFVPAADGKLSTFERALAKCESPATPRRVREMLATAVGYFLLGIAPVGRSNKHDHPQAAIFRNALWDESVYFVDAFSKLSIDNWDGVVSEALLDWERGRTEFWRTLNRRRTIVRAIVRDFSRAVSRSPSASWTSLSWSFLSEFWSNLPPWEAEFGSFSYQLLQPIGSNSPFINHVRPVENTSKGFTFSDSETARHLTVLTQAVGADQKETIPVPVIISSLYFLWRLLNLAPGDVPTTEMKVKGLLWAFFIEGLPIFIASRVIDIFFPSPWAYAPLVVYVLALATAHVTYQHKILVEHTGRAPPFWLVAVSFVWHASLFSSYFVVPLLFPSNWFMQTLPFVVHFVFDLFAIFTHVDSPSEPRLPLTPARLLGRVVAAIGLLTLFPIVIAVLYFPIRYGTGLPLFYMEETIGYLGKPLRVPKLSSVGKENERDRITSVGWHIRPAGFDEIPQLWLIATGRMQWFGPRPHKPHELVPYPEYVEKILSRTYPGFIGTFALTTHSRNGLHNFSQQTILDELKDINNASVWYFTKLFFKCAAACTRLSIVSLIHKRPKGSHRVQYSYAIADAPQRWDPPPPEWGFTGGEDQFWHRLPRQLVDALRTEPTNDGKRKLILDIGCAGARITSWIATQSPNFFVLGIERNGELVAEAREYLKRHGVAVVNPHLTPPAGQPAAAIMQVDGNEGLPFKDSSVDGIVVHRLRDEIVDPEKRQRLMSEINRVLAPGGYVSILEDMVVDSQETDGDWWEKRYIVSERVIKELAKLKEIPDVYLPYLNDPHYRLMLSLRDINHVKIDDAAYLNRESELVKLILNQEIRVRGIGVQERRQHVIESLGEAGYIIGDQWIVRHPETGARDGHDMIMKGVLARKGTAVTRKAPRIVEPKPARGFARASGDAVERAFTVVKEFLVWPFLKVLLLFSKTSNLHRHHGGSPSVEFVASLYRENPAARDRFLRTHFTSDPTDPKELRKVINHDRSVKDNEHFHNAGFDISRFLLDYDPDLRIYRRWTRQIVMESAAQGNRFMAIRASVGAEWRTQASFIETVTATVEGMILGEQDSSFPVIARLVLGVRKNIPADKAKQILEWWLALKQQWSQSNPRYATYLFGVDSIGAEEHWDPHDQAVYFEDARKRGQIIFSHAGEFWERGRLKDALERVEKVVDSGVVSVITNAICMFVDTSTLQPSAYTTAEQTEIQSIQKRVLAKIRDQRIILEISPTSNGQLCRPIQMEEGWKFIQLSVRVKQGIQISITDDDALYFQTSYLDEMKKLFLGRTPYGRLSFWDLWRLARNSRKPFHRLIKWKDRLPAAASVENPARTITPSSLYFLNRMAKLKAGEMPTTEMKTKGLLWALVVEGLPIFIAARLLDLYFPHLGAYGVLYAWVALLTIAHLYYEYRIAVNQTGRAPPIYKLIVSAVIHFFVLSSYIWIGAAVGLSAEHPIRFARAVVTAAFVFHLLRDVIAMAFLSRHSIENLIYQELKGKDIDDILRLTKKYGRRSHFGYPLEKIYAAIRSIGDKKKFRLPGGGWKGFYPEIEWVSGNMTGRLVSFQIMHQEKMPHATSELALITHDGELVVQENRAGYGDISAAGHNEMGHDWLQTIYAEGEEEIGLSRFDIDLAGRVIPILSPKGSPFFRRNNTIDHTGPPVYDPEADVFSYHSNPGYPNDLELGRLGAVVLTKEETSRLKKKFGGTEEVSGIRFMPLADLDNDSLYDEGQLFGPRSCMYQYMKAPALRKSVLSQLQSLVPEEVTISDQRLAKVKLILFDLGGVLLRRNNEKHRRSFRETYERLKLKKEITMPELWRLNEEYSQGNEYVLNRSGLEPYDRFEAYVETFNKIYLAPRGIAPLSVPDFARLFKYEFVPEPDLLPLLEELSKKFKIAVLSDQHAPGEWSEHEAVGAALQAGGFIKYIPAERYLVSYKLGGTKKDPATFRKALAILGVAPEEVLFLDDVPAFTRSARSLGVLTQTVDTTRSPLAENPVLKKLSTATDPVAGKSGQTISTISLIIFAVTGAALFSLYGYRWAMSPTISFSTAGTLMASIPMPLFAESGGHGFLPGWLTPEILIISTAILLAGHLVSGIIFFYSRKFTQKRAAAIGQVEVRGKEARATFKDSLDDYGRGGPEYLEKTPSPVWVLAKKMVHPIVHGLDFIGHYFAYVSVVPALKFLFSGVLWTIVKYRQLEPLTKARRYALIDMFKAALRTADTRDGRRTIAGNFFRSGFRYGGYVYARSAMRYYKRLLRHEQEGRFRWDKKTATFKKIKIVGDPSTPTHTGKRERAVEPLAHFLVRMVKLKGHLNDENDRAIVNFLMEKCLKDPDPWVVKPAAWALATLAPYYTEGLVHDTLKHIFAGLSRHPSATGVAAHARTLQLIPHTSSLERINGILRQPSNDNNDHTDLYWIRSSLIQAEEQIIKRDPGLPKTEIPALTDWLSELAGNPSEDWRVRYYAMRTLAEDRTPSRETTDMLKTVLATEPDETLQETAIYTLDQLLSFRGGPATLTALAELMFQFSQGRHFTGQGQFRRNSITEGYALKRAYELARRTKHRELLARVTPLLYPFGRFPFLNRKYWERVRRVAAHWLSAVIPLEVETDEDPVVFLDIEALMNDPKYTGNDSDLDHMIAGLMKTFRDSGATALSTRDYYEKRSLAEIVEGSNGDLRLRFKNGTMMQIAERLSLGKPARIQNRDGTMGSFLNRAAYVAVPLRGHPIVIIGKRSEWEELKIASGRGMSSVDIAPYLDATKSPILKELFAAVEQAAQEPHPFPDDEAFVKDSQMFRERGFDPLTKTDSWLGWAVAGMLVVLFATRHLKSVLRRLRRTVNPSDVPLQHLFTRSVWSNFTGAFGNHTLMPAVGNALYALTDRFKVRWLDPLVPMMGGLVETFPFLKYAVPLAGLVGLTQFYAPIYFPSALPALFVQAAAFVLLIYVAYRFAWIDHEQVFHGTSRKPRDATLVDRIRLFVWGIIFFLPFVLPAFGLSVSLTDAFELSAYTHMIRNGISTIAGGLHAMTGKDQSPYGLVGGRLKAETLEMKKRLAFYFGEQGMAAATADRIAETLVRMKPDSIDYLKKDNILNAAEAEAFIERNWTALTVELRNRDLAARIGALVDSYAEFTSGEKDILYIRLVPVQKVNNVMDEVSRSLAFHILLHRFNSFLNFDQAKAAVKKIKAKGIAETDAWHMVVNQGHEHIDEWIPLAEPVVTRVQKTAPGLADAWRIVIRNGLNGIPLCLIYNVILFVGHVFGYHDLRTRRDLKILGTAAVVLETYILFRLIGLINPNSEWTLFLSYLAVFGYFVVDYWFGRMANREWMRLPGNGIGNLAFRLILAAMYVGTYVQHVHGGASFLWMFASVAIFHLAMDLPLIWLEIVFKFVRPRDTAEDTYVLEGLLRRVDKMIISGPTYPVSGDEVPPMSQNQVEQEIRDLKRRSPKGIKALAAILRRLQADGTSGSQLIPADYQEGSYAVFEPGTSVEQAAILLTNLAALRNPERLRILEYTFRLHLRLNHKPDDPMITPEKCRARIEALTALAATTPLSVDQKTQLKNLRKLLRWYADPRAVFEGSLTRDDAEEEIQRWKPNPKRLRYLTRVLKAYIKAKKRFEEVMAILPALYKEAMQTDPTMPISDEEANAAVENIRKNISVVGAVTGTDLLIQQPFSDHYRYGQLRNSRNRPVSWTSLVGFGRGSTHRDTIMKGLALLYGLDWRINWEDMTQKGDVGVEEEVHKNILAFWQKWSEIERPYVTTAYRLNHFWKCIKGMVTRFIQRRIVRIQFILLQDKMLPLERRIHSILRDPEFVDQETGEVDRDKTKIALCAFKGDYGRVQQKVIDLTYRSMAIGDYGQALRITRWGDYICIVDSGIYPSVRLNLMLRALARSRRYKELESELEALKNQKFRLVNHVWHLPKIAPGNRTLWGWLQVWQWLQVRTEQVRYVRIDEGEFGMFHMNRRELHAWMYNTLTRHAQITNDDNRRESIIRTRTHVLSLLNEISAQRSISLSLLPDHIRFGELPTENVLEEIEAAKRDLRVWPHQGYYVMKERKDSPALYFKNDGEITPDKPIGPQLKPSAYATVFVHEKDQKELEIYVGEAFQEFLVYIGRTDVLTTLLKRIRKRSRYTNAPDDQLELIQLLTFMQYSVAFRWHDILVAGPLRQTYLHDRNRFVPLQYPVGTDENGNWKLDWLRDGRGHLVELPLDMVHNSNRMTLLQDQSVELVVMVDGRMESRVTDVPGRKPEVIGFSSHTMPLDRNTVETPHDVAVRTIQEDYLNDHGRRLDPEIGFHQIGEQNEFGFRREILVRSDGAILPVPFGDGPLADLRERGTLLHVPFEPSSLCVVQMPAEISTRAKEQESAPSTRRELRLLTEWNEAYYRKMMVPDSVGVKLANMLPILNSGLLEKTEEYLNTIDPLQKLANFLAQQDSLPTRADLLLLLGNDDLQTFKQAANLARLNRVARILVSGGRSTLFESLTELVGQYKNEEDINKPFIKAEERATITEAEIIKRILEHLGVRADKISLEKDGDNTANKIRGSLLVMKKLGGHRKRRHSKIKSVIVMDEARRMRRTAATAKKLIPSHYTVYHYSPAATDVSTMDRTERETFQRELVAEFEKLGGEYLRKGDIAETYVPIEVLAAYHSLKFGGLLPGVTRLVLPRFVKIMHALQMSPARSIAVYRKIVGGLTEEIAYSVVPLLMGIGLMTLSSGFVTYVAGFVWVVVLALSRAHFIFGHPKGSRAAPIGITIIAVTVVLFSLPWQPNLLSVMVTTAVSFVVSHVGTNLVTDIARSKEDRMAERITMALLLGHSGQQKYSRSAIINLLRNSPLKLQIDQIDGRDVYGPLAVALETHSNEWDGQRFQEAFRRELKRMFQWESINPEDLSDLLLESEFKTFQTPNEALHDSVVKEPQLTVFVLDHHFNGNKEAVLTRLLQEHKSGDPLLIVTSTSEWVRMRHRDFHNGTVRVVPCSSLDNRVLPMSFVQEKSTGLSFSRIRAVMPNDIELKLDSSLPNPLVILLDSNLRATVVPAESLRDLNKVIRLVADQV